MTDYFAHHPVTELTFLVLLIMIIVGITRMLRQPILLGYILAGIVVSPTVLNLVTNPESLKIFAELGISILLFMVGIGLNPEIIKKLGKVSVIAGVTQVLATFVIGLGLTYMLGFDLTTSAYVSLALTFSSTIVIVKLLSDNKETDRLFAKLSLGILILQDVIAMLVLMIIASIGSASEQSSRLLFSLFLILKISLSLILVYLIARYVLPKIMDRVAKSQEYLLLFSLGRCLVLGSLFALFGFSVEIGALLAGMSLASSPYRHQISSKLKSLRDFFVAMFFVYLGVGTTFDNITQYRQEILTFSLFVLIIQPIIVIVILSLMGYTKKNSFLTGITLAQISEFGFIVLGLGVSVGHLTDPTIVSMVILIGLVTIAASSYFFAYNDQIFRYMSPYLSFLEKRGTRVDQESRHKLDYTALVYGYNRIGKNVVNTLQHLKQSFLVVDYNPERIAELEKKGVPVMFGDATDPDLLEETDLHALQTVVVTIADFEPNLLVLKHIKEHHQATRVIVVANTVQEAQELYDHGADYVIMPHFLGSSHTVSLLEQFPQDDKIFDKRRAEHMEQLKSVSV